MTFDQFQIALEEWRQAKVVLNRLGYSFAAQLSDEVGGTIEFTIWKTTGRKERAILRLRPMLRAFETVRDVHDFAERHFEKALLD